MLLGIEGWPGESVEELVNSSSMGVETTKGSHRPRPIIQRHIVFFTSAGAIFLIFLLFQIGTQLGLGEPAGHAASHAIPGIAITLLAVAAGRLWPPPAEIPPGPAARRVVIVALAGVGLSQLVEAVSAYTEFPDSGPLHTTTMVTTNLFLLALIVGSGLAGVATYRSRRIPRWLATLAAAFAVIVLLALVTSAFGLWSAGP